METGSVSRSKRGSAVSTARPKTAASSRGLTTDAQAKADRLSLSRQAVDFLEKLELQRQEQERLAQRQKQEDRHASGEEALLDYAGKALKAMLKCQKIAARISAGDKVPPQDLKYLMKNDPSGYKLAMATRVPKKHPREYDTVLDEEDLKNLETDSGETLDSMSSPPVGAPGMSGSSGG